MFYKDSRQMFCFCEGAEKNDIEAAINVARGNSGLPRPVYKI